MRENLLFLLLSDVAASAQTVSSPPRQENEDLNSVVCMMADENVKFYLDGVANFTICVLGLAINAAAIGMLCRQNTNSLFVKLMISLVIYDLIYVLLSAICYSLPNLSASFTGMHIG